MISRSSQSFTSSSLISDDPTTRRCVKCHSKTMSTQFLTVAPPSWANHKLSHRSNTCFLLLHLLLPYIQQAHLWWIHHLSSPPLCDDPMTWHPFQRGSPRWRPFIGWRKDGDSLWDHFASGLVSIGWIKQCLADVYGVWTNNHPSSLSSSCLRPSIILHIGRERRRSFGKSHSLSLSIRIPVPFSLVVDLTC